MKTFYTLLLLTLSYFSAKASLPYMPLRITLQPSQSEYVEGEKISFKVWIKNTDKYNTYPVLIPDKQNVGKKLFYLRVIDMANNYTHIVAEESREIIIIGTSTLPQQHLPKVVNLKPNDSISFKVIWNSRIGDLNPGNNHYFDVPITQGKYRFQGFYAPDGTIIGDTLYNIISSTKDTKSANKLTFWEGGNPTFPVDITIKSSNKEKIIIDGVGYKINRSSTSEVFVVQYFINDTIMAKTVHFYPNGNKQYEFTSNYRNGDPGSLDYSITYFEDGDIKDYYKYDKNHCPSTIFRRTFYDNKQLDFYADIGAHNTFIEKVFNKEGIMMKKYLYSADRKLRTEYKYSPKTGKLKGTKEFKNPCDIIEIR